MTRTPFRLACSHSRTENGNGASHPAVLVGYGTDDALDRSRRATPERPKAAPPVRKLAAELGINPTTAARAYQNLERDGVIATIPGAGTYVADVLPDLTSRRGPRE